MNKPKFKVGDQVAVFVDLPEGGVNVPETFVTHAFLQPAGEAYENPFGVSRSASADSWAYYVDGITTAFFNERYLRAIENHDDYTTPTTAELERGIV